MIDFHKIVVFIKLRHTYLMTNFMMLASLINRYNFHCLYKTNIHVILFALDVINIKNLLTKQLYIICVLYVNRVLKLSEYFHFYLHYFITFINPQTQDKSWLIKRLYRLMQILWVGFCLLQKKITLTFFNIKTHMKPMMNVK